MNDYQVLLAVLGLFYLWECLHWVRHGTVAVARWWGRFCRLHLPSAVCGNQRGGFVPAQPLPPLGSFFTFSQLPCSLSAELALAFVATAPGPALRPRQTGRAVRWAELKAVKARGAAVHVNGTLFANAGSTEHARWLASQLRRLAGLAPAQREEAIRALLRGTFDTAALKQRLEEYERLALPVGRAANTLAVLLAVIAGLVVAAPGQGKLLLALAAIAVALMITTALYFRRAHLRLYPEAGEERFKYFLTTLLFAPATVRAGDYLSRPLLENFHPLAAAKVFCRDTDFRALAQLTLRDLKHPRQPLATEGQPELAATEAAWRGWLRQNAEDLVRAAKLAPDALLQPPAPEPTCRAYCPRCHAQFTSPEANCHDCGGLAVVSFSKTCRDLEIGQP